jgi:3-oxoacyl-[acyl-carrier-protein] synthase-1
MKTVSVVASGLVTAVGLDSASTCAAIRCAIDNFAETRFIDVAGERVMGAEVPLAAPWRGVSRLVHMAVPAIRECLAHIGSANVDQIPLLLCVAEERRPGRLDGLDETLLDRIQVDLGVRFHPQSRVIPRGRVAGALAMDAARTQLQELPIPFCIVAGVDSLFVADTLAAYERSKRLLTSRNSNGFIPGEAAAAVLVSRSHPPTRAALVCRGLAWGIEKVTIDSDEPLRADGLIRAITGAFSDAGCGYEAVDYRITDANGEQYGFKEAALAMTRTLRTPKELFDIWHPADCIGEVGASTGPCAFAVALAAVRKHYAPGPGVLLHFGSDDGERAALVFRTGGGGAS